METKIYQYKTLYSLNNTINLMLNKYYKQKFIT